MLIYLGVLCGKGAWDKSAFVSGLVEAMVGVLLGTALVETEPAFPVPLSREIIAAQVTGAGGPGKRELSTSYYYMQIHDMLRHYVGVDVSTNQESASMIK